MRDKFSDNILNTDSVPERNQEPTEEGKIKLLDVVALTQDVPEHNLKRGEVGTVVEILATGEAFEVEFSDDNGQMYKCLSFPPSQLRVIHDEPINVNPNRQANDALQGYYYQLCHTVNSWLDLADNDILYLEVAEDFDIESDRTFAATQVKHTQDNITLRSQQVIDGINNYWELRTNNPNRRVKFRLLTKSKIVKEHGNPLEADKPGLEVWSRCFGDEVAIQKISDFLQTDGKISEEVNDFLKVSSLQEIYEQLIEPITWETDSKPVSFVDQSINEKLVHHGDRHGISPSAAKKVFYPLIDETWKVAGQSENRKLTRLRFLEIFEEKTKRLVSEQYLQHIEMLAAMKGAVGTGFIGGSSDITIQSHFHIQTGIPPSYLNVVLSRKDLITNIRTKLQSDNMVIIHGGVDRGKTTLAKLVANAIDNDWFWLKFTNKNTSQIVQHLQQLATAVSNEPSQVNVVLDDLNLQPQGLEEYEDVLGVVIYRVLERGAKLLITSQHKPPDNLIRSLGVSPSVVVNTPDFTTSEIEQFAEQLGCPAEHAKTWSEWVQMHTNGHPRLVHARLTQLQQEDWKYQGKVESILQTPQEVVKEREEARQLLMGLPEDQRELLYRLSLLTEFRTDYAINIGEIPKPKPIPYPGDIFSQLVGPWIDQINQTYYTISPLLTNAAKAVWSESKVNDLHAQIADAILEAEDLTTIEARSVLIHCFAGQNREGLIVVMHALMTAPVDSWGMLSQEFSWLRRIKVDPHEELFPEDPFVNHLFRSLQYRIAVEIEPEFAPKILEIWDKETKPYEPYLSYLLSRLMLAMQVLIYYQVSLPAKQMVGYLKEMIAITNSNEELKGIYDDSMGQLKGYKTGKSNFFSVLFGFVYARRPLYAPFLSELIDALDELQPEIRGMLLADFEDDTIDSRVLVDGIWGSEANLENPDWERCLCVYDKVIEKTIAWNYPHFAAAAARGKATIYDEYLDESDTAHNILQDFISKVGTSPVIEEERAVIYLHQKRYKEALNIYERLLPEWKPSSGQLDVIPVEGCRRASICAASLNDWKKAATFLEEGVKRTQNIENTTRHIGLYADAGFAHFKGGNILNSIKLMSLTLQKFETLPENNTDLKYLTLKKRLVYTIGWMSVHGGKHYPSELAEPPIGFCSDSETNEDILTSPDFPIGFAWLNLALIEYKFGHGSAILEQILQSLDRNTHPALNYFLSAFELQHDFRNKTFDDLPQCIHQLMNACNLMQEYEESDNGIRELGINTILISDLPNLDSVEHITVILVASVLVQLPIGIEDIHKTLSIWRTNASDLPIKENIFTALDLIKSTLLGDQNSALTVLKTQADKPEKRLVAALKIVQNKETCPGDLLYAHTFITTSLIGKTWEGFVVTDLAKLLSVQWLQKRTEVPIRTVSQMEDACKSGETGKKKIGKILLAASQTVSDEVTPKDLQQFRVWADSL